MTGVNHELAKKSITAFLWGTGGSFARIFLTLGTQIVLARLLGPTAYGLFALGVVVVMLSAFFADIGLAYGLIQKKEVCTDDVRFVWTWQCVLGLLVASTMYFSAESLTVFFAKPESKFIFQWLAIVCFFNSLAAPSTCLLKRDLNYKAIQLAQLASYFIGYVCVGIPLAILGHGSASLVASWLVQSTCNLLILYIKVRHPISIKLWIPDGKKMLQYGGTVFATNLINWVMTAGDKIFVGRIFPATTVGLYTTAFNLVNSPTNTIYGSLQSVVFSACTKLQGDQQALRNVFLRLLSLITLVAFPLFALLAVGANLAIVAIYGLPWIGAAPFLTAFAFVMPFLLIWGISTPVLWNSGHAKLEFWLQMPMVVLWLIVLYAVSDSTPRTVAITTAFLFSGRCIVILIAVARVMKISVKTFLDAIRGGIILTSIMVVSGMLLVGCFAGIAISAPIRFIIFLITGCAIYITCLLALSPILLDKQLAVMLASSNARLPHWTAPMVNYILRSRSK